MLALPAAGLTILWIAGLGPAALLARRLPPSAQSALAAPLSAAALACTSVLVYFGISVKLTSAGTLALLAACTAIWWKRIPRSATRLLTPVPVALVAVALVGVPFEREGDWGAATFSNADPYLWSSQARSLLDGPPADRGHPDRIPYDRIHEERWPTGIPVALAATAWIAQSDPAHVYGAYAALLSALLALSVYFCARGALLWPPGIALTAGCVAGANGYLLYGTFSGWQRQTALATFGVLSVFCLRVAFDRESLARERVLAGAFAAAGLATLGWAFVSFAGMLAAVAAGYVFVHRGRYSWRRIASVVVGFCLAVAVIGAVPLVQVFRGFRYTSGWRDEVLSQWSFYDPALPSDALGLVPRTPALLHTAPEWTLVAVAIVAGTAAALALIARTSSLRNARGLVAACVAVVVAEQAIFRIRYITPEEWVVAAVAVAAVVVLVGLAGAMPLKERRNDALVVTTLFVFAVLAVFFVGNATPYYSIRLMGYAAPIFVLLALAPLLARSSRRRRSRAVACARNISLAAGVAMFAIGSVTAITQTARGLRTTNAAEALATAAATAAPGATIEVDVRDTWDQVWLAYFLRDHEVSVTRPSGFFTGFTTRGASDVRTTAAARYRIETRRRQHSLVVARDLFLNRVEATEPSPTTSREEP